MKIIRLTLCLFALSTFALGCGGDDASAPAGGGDAGGTAAGSGTDAGGSGTSGSDSK